jgi:MoxR-like ATPase
VKFDDGLVAYLLDIVRATREHPGIHLGASTRGAVALRRASQARALVDGRDYCIPEDVRDLAVPVLAHRIVLDPRQDWSSRGPEEGEWLIREILDGVAVPL